MKRLVCLVLIFCIFTITSCGKQNTNLDSEEILDVEDSEEDNTEGNFKYMFSGYLDLKSVDRSANSSIKLKPGFKKDKLNLYMSLDKITDSFINDYAYSELMQYIKTDEVTEYVKANAVVASQVVLLDLCSADEISKGEYEDSHKLSDYVVYFDYITDKKVKKLIKSHADNSDINGFEFKCDYKGFGTILCKCSYLANSEDITKIQFDDEFISSRTAFNSVKAYKTEIRNIFEGKFRVTYFNILGQFLYSYLDKDNSFLDEDYLSYVYNKTMYDVEKKIADLGEYSSLEDYLKANTDYSLSEFLDLKRNSAEYSCWLYLISDYLINKYNITIDKEKHWEDFLYWYSALTSTSLEDIDTYGSANEDELDSEFSSIYAVLLWCLDNLNIVYESD